MYGGDRRPTTMLQAGRSSLRLRLLQAGRSSLPQRLLQAELFYFARKKIGIGRGAVATTTAAGGTVLLCRHDAAASILDFKPRLANRCSQKGQNRSNPSIPRE